MLQEQKKAALKIMKIFVIKNYFDKACFYFTHQLSF